MSRAFDRAAYSAVNDQMATAFLYQLGRGGGLCADLTWLLTCAVKCLHYRIRFCLGANQRRLGFVVKDGWTDYFRPFYPVVPGPFVHFLNRPVFPLHAKVPWTRSIARYLLRQFTRGEIQYFMFDNLGDLPYVDIAEMGGRVGFLEACQQVSSVIWDFKTAIHEEISLRRERLDLPDSYVALHIRRGDKRRERVLTPILNYVQALEPLAQRTGAIFVATDDYAVIRALERELGHHPRLFHTLRENATGHDEKRFNALPSEVRFELTKSLLLDLEILKSAEYFLGSGVSNVSLFVEMLRGGENCLSVDQSGIS